MSRICWARAQGAERKELRRLDESDAEVASCQSRDRRCRAGGRREAGRNGLGSQLLTCTDGFAHCILPASTLTSPAFSRASPFSASSRFTIHGLWPEYANGSWPEYCNDHEENEPAPAALEPVMQCRWPLPNDTASWLWEHEWEKHGTCSETVVGDREEFDGTVLNLDYALDLDTAFEEAGIDMGEEDTVVMRTDIEAAIRSAFDVAPQLRCVSDGVTPATISPTNQTLLPALYEVWICLDLNLMPIECPEPVGAPNCQDTIILKGGKTGTPPECAGRSLGIETW